MGTLRKPVVVRTLANELLLGYAGALPGLDAASLEILGLDGRVLRRPWPEVKWVCYVRDLPAEPATAVYPERLLHKKFAARPRTPGLWLRMTLTDGDELEGLAPNDRSLLDGPGVLLTPPDTRSNTQRIYLPRTAIATLEVFAVIGLAARTAPVPAPRPQPVLVPLDAPPPEV